MEFSTLETSFSRVVIRSAEAVSMYEIWAKKQGRGRHHHSYGAISRVFALIRR
jgi:hypothetical protein